MTSRSPTLVVWWFKPVILSLRRPRQEIESSRLTWAIRSSGPTGHQCETLSQFKRRNRTKQELKCSSAVECLPGMHTRVPSLVEYKPSVVGHTCHPSTWGIAAGGPEVQGHFHYIVNLKPAWATWDYLRQSKRFPISYHPMLPSSSRTPSLRTYSSKNFSSLPPSGL